MGTFEKIPLYKGLNNYTSVAAFSDPRFPSLTAQELSNITLEVSLLSDKEEITSHADWVIGVHGLAIEFKAAGKSYHATYLPEVAVEQHWDKTTALLRLIRKAGYVGPVNNDVFDYFKRYKYTSHKVSMSHDEYMARLSTKAK
jgi:uncharacterized protein (TIGR00296 family)